MASRVTDKDTGYRALMGSLRELRAQDPSIVVGLVGTKGRAAHRGAQGKLSVAQLGAFHEFGVGVPTRSFLRSTVDQNGKVYVRAMTSALRRSLVQHVRARSAWDLKQDKGLQRVGLKVEGDVKERISLGIPPPNAPVTIARKGSSKPLIDKGQLRISISSEVRMRMPSGGPIESLPGGGAITRAKRTARRLMRRLRGR